jgi:predicted nucleotidyltransferase
MLITQEQIDYVVSVISETEKPDKIVLFGSYANGDATEDSDLDLLIVKNSDIPTNKRCRELRKRLRGIKIPLDLLMYTQEEILEWKDTKTAFITQVLESGKVVYGEKN